MDVVGEKSGLFKLSSPRRKNVPDWCSVKEGMLVVKVWIFFSSFPGYLQPSQTVVRVCVCVMFTLRSANALINEFHNRIMYRDSNIPHR